MTERGEAAFRTASERHGRWAEVLMADLSPERIEAAGELLREIQRRIARSTVADSVIARTEET